MGLLITNNVLRDTIVLHALNHMSVQQAHIHLPLPMNALNVELGNIRSQLDRAIAYCALLGILVLILKPLVPKSVQQEPMLSQEHLPVQIVTLEITKTKKVKTSACFVLVGVHA